MDGQIRLLVERKSNHFISGFFRLHYQQDGTGDPVWLTFHGFGQNHTAFEPVAKVLSQKGTVYNFDLLFHGESRYNHNRPIDKREWVGTINSFLKSHGIKRFSLAGYSIGCRLMMPLIEAFRNQIDHVVFLAPDGIRDSFWYWWATKPVLRGLFKFTVFRPGMFFRFLELLEKNSLADKSLISVARKQMKERKNRLRVYKTWVYFSKLKISRSSLTRFLNGNRISSIVILSLNDKLIGKRSLHPFLEKLQHNRIAKLDVPHHKLIDNSTGILHEYLNENKVPNTQTSDRNSIFHSDR